MRFIISRNCALIDNIFALGSSFNVERIICQIDLSIC